GMARDRRFGAGPRASRAQPEAAESRGVPDRVTAAAEAGVAPRAAAGRRRPGGPGGAGCRRPAPARSTGRPAQDGAAVGSSSPASAYRTGPCAPGRTGECTPATSGPDPAARPRVRPTTTTAPLVAGYGQGPAGPARAGWC